MWPKLNLPDIRLPSIPLTINDLWCHPVRCSVNRSEPCFTTNCLQRKGTKVLTKAVSCIAKSLLSLFSEPTNITFPSFPSLNVSAFFPPQILGRLCTWKRLYLTGLIISAFLLPFCKMLKQLLVIKQCKCCPRRFKTPWIYRRIQPNFDHLHKNIYLILIDHSDLWVWRINPGVWTFRWKILCILSDSKSTIILAVHTEAILFLLEFQVSLIE